MAAFPSSALPTTINLAPGKFFFSKLSFKTAPGFGQNLAMTIVANLAGGRHESNFASLRIAAFCNPPFIPFYFTCPQNNAMEDKLLQLVLEDCSKVQVER